VIPMVPRVHRLFTLCFFNNLEISQTTFICIFSFCMTYQSYIFYFTHCLSRPI
jgi:hypothetical protein